MAIIKSLAVGKAKGSMGNLTYRFLGGDTIGSSKVAFPKVPRTLRQMARRIGWGNLVNMWQAFTGDLHPSFELAVGRTSDYNLFIGRNTNRPPYLTKEQAAKGGCVVADYVITEGSLQSIQNTLNGNSVITSDINVGSLTITDETNLRAFSAAIIGNNSGWVEGDQLTAFILLQSYDGINDVPRVTVRGYRITLDTSNAAEEILVLDLLGNNNECFVIHDNKIGFSASINGAGCYIHSRINQDGKTEVSTQSLVVSSNIAEPYSTNAQAMAAIQSYGGKLTTDFLTPQIDQPFEP